MECLRNKFTEGTLLNGRYQTISPLNHGSFGMVFTAHDLRTNDQVAIKCLTKKNTSGDSELDLAVDERSEELALHRSLGSHSNIVNLIDSFETDAHFYLVMEFCSQGDMYEAIRNGHGPLQTEHVRDFMLQLVDAVAYIHSRGVYHRDIKPENIFLTKEGAMKLGDFGLATTDKWSYEVTVGSDRYMAPEQFDSEGAGYSPADADTWAIGICLLNILFSRNPFTTPTESDPIFLDYSRDKQSLFDVFPSMSQDTYEVIVQCMNMDPKRRSLIGARDALRRVVSFTTEDETFDDFCGGEKASLASANREPLRTPSIQSPQVDGGSFPWKKALHDSPQRLRRQLSAIPDDESYSEDLFSKSEQTTDWCSGSIQTPSASSVLGSQLGASLRFMMVDQTVQSTRRSPLTGSLPISMIKPLPLSMSALFGHREESVSKSWSDMWEEEEEEERNQQITLKDLNSRTWSHESKTDSKCQERGEFGLVSQTIKGNVDEDLVADGFFFQDPVSAKTSSTTTARYSPPSKRTDFDKWTALGERRRAQSVRSEPGKVLGLKQPRYLGLGYKDHDPSVLLNSSIKSGTRDRTKDSTYRGKDWNWRRERRTDLSVGDIEWVGGW